MSKLSIIQIAFELWGALFCLICGLTVFIGRKAEKKRSLIIMLALFTETLQLISDAFAWIFRGNTTKLGFYMVRVSNLMVFLTNYLIVIILTYYISAIIENSGKKVHNFWIRSIVSVSAVGVFLLMLSQFNSLYYYFDENNYYHRTGYNWINIAIILITIFISFSMLMKYRRAIERNDFISLVIYFIVPITASIAQALIYGISLSNIANTLTILLLFLVHERDKSTRLIEQERKVMSQQLLLAEQKEELANTKISLLMSQIQPHFISNTLLTIQGLYNEGSKNADMIMDSFIKFLQRSFSDISSNTTIPVSREIEHTKNYTNIVGERWSDMSVEYNVLCTDFLVPPLTIQPLVENAVRHGLMPLESGGKVKISTLETDNFYCIIIEDNGVGFNMSNPKPKYNDGRVHIGIPNIRERLEKMCNGTLEITSSVNKGTTVKIRIPKEG